MMRGDTVWVLVIGDYGLQRVGGVFRDELVAMKSYAPHPWIKTGDKWINESDDATEYAEIFPVGLDAFLGGEARSMSEPIRSEDGDVLVCHFCTVGAAEERVRAAWGDPRLLMADWDREVLLCRLCHDGSTQALAVTLYDQEPNTEAIIERAVARMLNAMQGTIGS